MRKQEAFRGGGGTRFSRFSMFPFFISSLGDHVFSSLRAGQRSFTLPWVGCWAKMLGILAGCLQRTRTAPIAESPSKRLNMRKGFGYVNDGQMSGCLILGQSIRSIGRTVGFALTCGNCFESWLGHGISTSVLETREQGQCNT